MVGGDRNAADASSGDTRPEARNEVLLCGRLAADPQVRTLPSGDQIASWRVVVERDPRDGPRPVPGHRVVTVDTVDCTGWRADVRRSVARWRAGDMVEVEGAIRRRFYRTGGAPASRWDVLARAVRRVARSAR